MSIHFLTAADQLYEEYVIPFLFSVLASNHNSTAEVCLEDASTYKSAESKGVDFLENNFSGRFKIRNFNDNYYESNLPKKAATFRFLELPTISAEITYISDIDIFYTYPHIYEYEKKKLQSHEYFFNNHIRPSMDRFTGTFGVKSDEYYNALKPFIKQFYLNPKPFLDFGKGDEAILFSLLTQSMATPNQPPTQADDYTIRRIHGVHCSPNREIAPCSGPGWGFDSGRIEQYRQLKSQSQSLWGEWEKLLSQSYRENIYQPLEAFIADK